MKTKTVQGYFGPKQVTREDFIRRWVEQAAELHYLCDTGNEMVLMRGLQDKVAEMAGRRWDKMPD